MTTTRPPPISAYATAAAISAIPTPAATPAQAATPTRARQSTEASRQSLPELLPVTEMIVPVGGASFQLRKATITPGSGACGSAFCTDGKATVSLTLLLGDVSVMLDSAEEMTFCAS